MAKLPYNGETIRAEIDDVDKQIIDLIAERFDLVSLVHMLKIRDSLEIRDLEREAEITDTYVEAFGEKDGTAIARSILGVVD